MTRGLSDGAMAFLEARGLDVELADRLGLFSESGAGGGEVLAFPFRRNGVVINHKRRKLPKDGFWQDKDAAKGFWNEDALRDDALLQQPPIITEGELDAMAALQAGFQRTVSVPDGAPPPSIGREPDQERGMAKYAWIGDVEALLTRERAPAIILATDDDPNGRQLREDLANRLGRARCKFLIYPLARDPERRGRPRLKDLNEVLEDYGVAGVRKTVENARFIAVPGKFRLSEIPEPPMVPTWDLNHEYPLLSENMRFRPGDLSVGTGIPSYGKTTVVTAIWGALVERYGLRIAVGSFEQDVKPDFRRNLRSWYCRSPEHQLSARQIEEADEWIEQHFVFIKAPEDADATLDWFIGVAQAAVIQDGCQVVIADPWNELEHIRERHVSLTEYVNHSLREVRRFAKAFRVHFQILAHPTKAVRMEGGAYRCPTMYDISDSAAWYNKADLGFIIHRPNPVETQVVVEKSRYHDQTGTPGEVFMHYSKDTRRFAEVGRASMEAEIDR
jgi:twinkle protein